MRPFQTLGLCITMAFAVNTSGCSTYDRTYADSEGFYGTLHLQNSVTGRRQLEALCKATIARQIVENPIDHFSLGDLKDYQTTFLVIDENSTAPRIRLEPLVPKPTDEPVIDCAFEQPIQTPPQLVISHPYADNGRLLHPLASGSHQP
jgi:hypothetical protein